MFILDQSQLSFKHTNCLRSQILFIHLEFAIGNIDDDLARGTFTHRILRLRQGQLAIFAVDYIAMLLLSELLLANIPDLLSLLSFAFIELFTAASLLQVVLGNSIGYLGRVDSDFVFG